MSPLLCIYFIERWGDLWRDPCLSPCIWLWDGNLDSCSGGTLASTYSSLYIARRLTSFNMLSCFFLKSDSSRWKEKGGKVSLPIKVYHWIQNHVCSSSKLFHQLTCHSVLVSAVSFGLRWSSPLSILVFRICYSLSEWCIYASFSWCFFMARVSSWRT